MRLYDVSNTDNQLYRCELYFYKRPFNLYVAYLSYFYYNFMIISAECKADCRNCATTDTEACMCECMPGWTGVKCTGKI